MNKKKITLFAFCILILVGITFLILFITNNLYTKIESYISPNKDYKIVIKGSGPRWSFGAEDIKVYAYKNDFKGYFSKTIYTTSIANDGKILHSDNFLIRWENDVAYLTLIGEEQETEDLVITFNNKIIIESIK